jgi:phage terminase large subunit
MIAESRKTGKKFPVEVQMAVKLFKEKEFRFITEVEVAGILVNHDKQRIALEMLTDLITEELGYGGAAGGAKSWTGCAWEVLMCAAFPGIKCFVGREELTRLMGSTYKTFQKVLKRYGFRREVDWKFNGQYHYIEFSNGSTIDFLDLKFQPRDPDYERFGSLEYTIGWIEEGGEVHSGAYDTLKTRVGRHMNDRYGILGKLLVTLNPKKNWCHSLFWKPFKAGLLKEGNRIRFLQALATDNPHQESGYLDKLKAITDKVRKQRLLHGNFDYDDDDNALMDYDSIMDIFTNEHVPPGEGFITVDVARFGDDKTKIYRWSGWRVVQKITLEKKKVPEVAEAVKVVAEEHDIPMSRIVVDDDGVGGGVADILGCKRFVNGSSPMPEPESTKANKGYKLKPNYKNLRSQCYFRLSMRVNEKGLLVLTKSYEERERISEELEQIKKKETDNDKVLQVVAKDDIKQLLGRSPDDADALMMREYFELKPPTKPKDLSKFF